MTQHSPDPSISGAVRRLDLPPARHPDIPGQRPLFHTPTVNVADRVTDGTQALLHNATVVANVRSDAGGNPVEDFIGSLQPSRILAIVTTMLKNQPDPLVYDPQNPEPFIFVTNALQLAEWASDLATNYTCSCQPSASTAKSAPAHVLAGKG